MRCYLHSLPYPTHYEGLLLSTLGSWVLNIPGITQPHEEEPIKPWLNEKCFLLSIILSGSDVHAFNLTPKNYYNKYEIVVLSYTDIQKKPHSLNPPISWCCLPALQHAGYTVEFDWEVHTLAVPNDGLWSLISSGLDLISAPAAWDITQGSKKCVHACEL